MVMSRRSQIVAVFVICLFTFALSGTPRMNIPKITTPRTHTSESDTPRVHTPESHTSELHHKTFIEDYNKCKEILKVIHTVDRVNYQTISRTDKVKLITSLTLNMGFCINVCEFIQAKRNREQIEGECKAGLIIIVTEVEKLFFE